MRRLTLHRGSGLGKRGLLPASRSRLSNELIRYVSGGCNGGEGSGIRLRILRTLGIFFAKIGACCG
jgi:hypothetical protein